MIKSLLVTPSATSLFARAIIQSAPLDTVDQTPAIANAVGKRLVNDMLRCRNILCLQKLDVSEILAGQNLLVQDNLANFAQYQTAMSEPLHVVVDGTLVTRQFRDVVSSGGQLEGSSKELIFTTVEDEGCLSIAGMYVSFPSSFPPFVV
jgi:carboxylesterase type B